MEKILMMCVYLLDDRYHGAGDWPPSPARLFQALVAGNSSGAHLAESCSEALCWLESMPAAPRIRVQRGWPGSLYTLFVPNNDLDARKGDPQRIAELRVRKSVQPRHIDARQPIVYWWRFKADESSLAKARQICEMATKLYQLGRGVDPAWATGEILDPDEAEARLACLPGEDYFPGPGKGTLALQCPHPGSLESLMLRFKGQRQRLRPVHSDKKKITIYFTNPPKPNFRSVAYNPQPSWRLFELRVDRNDRPFRSWPQARAAALVENARDAAAQRLLLAMPEHRDSIERFLIGRGATSSDKAHRVRLIPLPSIGHPQTNRSIRRLLVLVPPESPLCFRDVEWAFSGLTLFEGKPEETMLVIAEDLSMLDHYAVASGKSHRLWRSVTPVVLPPEAARRRIDPALRSEQAKSGTERLQEEQRAGAALVQALRHADIPGRLESLHLQREPFSAKGLRAEAFAEGTRFAKERLWHVEIRFSSPREGPIVIGDGRYLGLGVLAPVPETPGVLAFRMEEGMKEGASAETLAQALRRATMARVQHHLGREQTMPPFFTGHAPDGSALRNGDHQHLAFVADLPGRRLLILAPHILERRAPRGGEPRYLDLLDEAMQDMTSLLAGRDGNVQLSPIHVDTDEDCLFGRFRRWESVTTYKPTRHAKKMAAADALVADVLQEISRCGLPQPKVDVLHAEEGPRGGLSGRLRLEFHGAEKGPLILGKTRHLGGGVFRGC